MQKILAFSLAAALSTAGAQTYISSNTSNIELGLTAGYAAGLSGEIFVHKPNVVGPVGIKANVAFTKASDALIDSAPLSSDPLLGNYTFAQAKTDLGATESGSHFTAGLDGTYSLGEIAPGVSALAYAGGRYGKFSATESYADGSTSTTTSSAFGIGAGAQLSYALAGNLSLVGDLGIDHYFPAAISDGTDNGSYATNEPGYAGARARFAFPGTVFKAKIGIKAYF